MRIQHGLMAAALFGLLGMSSAQASLITIDFDGLAGPAVSTYYESGVTFGTESGAGEIWFVEGPNGTTALGPSSYPFPYMRADFDVATDFVSVDIGDFNQDADDIFLEAYDAAGNLLASSTDYLNASFEGLVTLSVSAIGIDYVVFGSDRIGFTSSRSSVMADNFTYAAVPIPAAAWLFGSALFGMGFVRRRA